MKCGDIVLSCPLSKFGGEMLVDDLPPDLEKKLASRVKKYGLDAHFSSIRKLARFTILLRVAPVKNTNRIPLGCTRLGGVPDLPKGWNWPKENENAHYGPEERQFLDFIAQINLAELPSLGRRLPRTGILYFFAGINQKDKYVFRVLFFKGPPSRLIRQAAPDRQLFIDKYGCPTGTLRVKRFLPSISLPDAFDYLRNLPDDLYDAYSTLEQEFHSDSKQAEPTSRLLGYPFAPHGKLLPNAKWQLLLQVESYFAAGDCLMNFGDAGCLSFIGPSDEMNKGVFSKCRLSDFSN
jgi:uncharacterized protein YwqG